MFTVKSGKRFKNYKGVSPLVASVLLIAFTITLAAVLTAWLSNFQTQQEEKVQASQQKIDCGYASIDAKGDFSRFSVDYAGTGDAVLETYIVNNGLTDISLTQVQVINKYGKTSRLYSFETPVSIGKDKGIYLDINLTLPVQELGIVSPEELDRIRIFTVCDGVSTTILKPYGGWEPLDSAIKPITNLTLGE